MRSSGGLRLRWCMKKIVLAANDEVIKGVEIDPGGIALHPANRIKTKFPLQLPECGGQTMNRLFQDRGVNLVGMIAQPPQQHGPAVGDLADHTGGCHLGGKDRIVRPPVLFAPQQHIARYRPLDAGKEAAMLGKKAQAHAPLAAKAHEKRAAADIAEADDGIQGMQRQPQGYLALDADNDGLAVLGQIGPLGGDEQGIEMFFHRSTILRR